MSPVKESFQSQQEIEQDNKRLQEKENKLTDSLLNSLDLPADEEPKPAQRPDINTGGKIERRPKPDVTPVKEGDNIKEPIEDEESDEEEEVVPKSKFEKRLNSEVARRKVLEAEVAELRNKTSMNVTGTHQDRLENMTTAELDDLYFQAMENYRDEPDLQRRKELVQLTKDINIVVQTAPNRFYQKQEKALNVKLGELIAEEGDSDLKEKLFPIALDFFNKYSDLKKLERGSATALEMAYDYWKETKRFQQGKSKEKEQKQQITKLKQKTSLDSGTIKGQSSASQQKSYQAAKSGGLQEKTDYVMDNLLNVDKILSSI